MKLCLTEAHVRALTRHALAAAPEEACGILAGVNDRVHQVIPITNAASDPRRLFRLADQELVRALFALESDGLSLVGIYHSHPDGDPIPSPTDIQQAYYPDTAYVIIGLRRGELSLAAWRIRAGQIAPVDIHIGLPVDAGQPQDSSLSAAQKTAIIASALLAFVFMIILSLSLLPPAPVIVTPLP